MDPYALCPCGSGKKVKFCCQAILPEMAKIERLQENNQPRMALQIIDKLLKDHPDNGWLVTQRAMALINDERYEESRDSLVPYLRNHPDDPLANALLALTMLQLEPVEKCKKVIHRAFLKSMSARPELCAILASALGDYHLSEDHFMAVRQHLAIMLRLTQDEDRHRALQAMLEFDGDPEIPYPLRGGQPLPHYEPGEEHQAQFKKAQRLFIHGCFAEAADVLDAIVQQDAESAELWHTIGLMRAWDGDDARAAQALHTAARWYSDATTAVDVETIAQLLDRQQPEHRVGTRSRVYEVESLSRLLTRLDNEDRVVRIRDTEERLPEQMAAAYHVLDRPLPTEAEIQSLTLEVTPRAIGRVILLDAGGENFPPRAVLFAVQGTPFEQSASVFEAASGDMIRRSEQNAEEDDADTEDAGTSQARDDLNWMDLIYIPASTPVERRQQLRWETINKCIHHNWMESPQSALRGKNPREAAGDPELRVPLAAAIRVFDSFLSHRGTMLDQAELRRQLGLEPETMISAGDDLDLNTLSSMQLQRLNLREMSDDLFERVMQRAMISRHSGHCFQILREFLNNRPAMLERDVNETMQAYSAIAEYCSHSFRNDEALDWMRRGFEFATAHGAPFESLVLWKMQELTIRSQTPDASGTRELLLELWNYYGAKLPVIRKQLVQVVDVLGIDPPWEGNIITAGSVSQASAVWTGEPQAASGEKKLWLPD